MNPLNHVAIIMDGNGRWAKRKKKSRNFGHYSGSKNIIPIVKFCIKKKIKYLTLYAFSYDNWKRPKKESFFLFKLLEKFINENLHKFIKKNICLKFIGESNKLSKEILKLLKKTERLTKKNYLITVIIALNYSSRLEIAKGAQIIAKIKKNRKQKFLVEDFKNNLYTKKIPDPEILIRTGGYNRLSDFLLWQLAYTELFFLKKMWPDFNSNDLNMIIKKFMKIKRNFGSI